MIVGLRKETLLALPRAARRVVRTERFVTARAGRAQTPRTSPLAAFTCMLERQADLIIRQLGE